MLFCGAAAWSKNPPPVATADHAQIVMAVAIIAIARKVIILDVKDLSGLALVGIAAIILALSIGYYLIKKKDAALKESQQEAST